MKNGVLAQLSLVGKYEITLGERPVPYTLKRSSRARLVWLRVKQPTGLTVTVPRSYQVKNLNTYLRANSAWILRNLARCERNSRELMETQNQSADTISYLGNLLTITSVYHQANLPLIRLAGNKLIINLDDSGEKPTPPALENWMREQAVQLIVAKALQYSKGIGVLYRRITIRDQRSRWGSCSHLKNLSFNWRLIMAPEPVLDYVVIHELCHLKEMNHSKSFWSLVARYCPQWREKRQWLNKHGKELRASFPG